jgi:hypothetical protein
MIERILAPTDFSEPSPAAFRYALELADAGGGGTFRLHVVGANPRNVTGRRQARAAVYRNVKECHHGYFSNERRQKPAFVLRRR